MLTAILTLALAFAYRCRGGGFIHLLDFEYRLLWGCALALSYIFMNASNPDIIYTFLLLPLAYSSMAWIPHSYCQNMGRWDVPQNKWPSWFLPALTNLQWTALPMAARTLHDFLAMAGVAFCRAVVVFAPYMATQYVFHDKIALYHVIAASGVLVMGQPLAYLLGWLAPISIGKSLPKKSPEWGEAFTGLVYGVALCLL